MSTMPWGTMNGWLRLEAEQRNAWTKQRVQDVRAAQVGKGRAPAAGLAGLRPALGAKTELAGSQLVA